MPSDRIPCPLCQQEIARNNLGSHLFSSRHKDDVVSRNHSTLEKEYERWQDAKTLSNLDLFPLRVRDSTVYCCFGCKKVYQDSALHFSKSLPCREKHLDCLATLLGRPSRMKKSSSEPIASGGQDDRIKALEAEVRLWKRKFEEAEEEKDKEIEAADERASLAESEAINLINLVIKLSGIEHPKGEAYLSYAERVEDAFAEKEEFFKSLSEQTKAPPLPPAAPEAPPAAPKPPPVFSANLYQPQAQVDQPSISVPILASTKRFVIKPKQVGVRNEIVTVA